MLQTWDTTIAELMQIFRGSLTALIPSMEQCRLEWRDNPYDDWDEIARALYKKIVTRSIE